jgi:hypothetical protein
LPLLLYLSHSFFPLFPSYLFLFILLQHRRY